MYCIRGICILAPGANVSANMIFHPVIATTKKRYSDTRSRSVNFTPYKVKYKTGNVKIQEDSRV